MHGNVQEWCLDWYGQSLPGGSVTDPIGPESGSIRMSRGGNWTSAGWHCRSALRDGYAPERRLDYLGFRVALVAVP